jgi:lipid-A-disaccharide synthase
VDFYRKHGVQVDWIGHPLVDQVHATMSRAEFAQQYNLNATKPIVALLPGSRAGELAQHMPILMEAAAKLRAAAPERQFALALASGLAPAQVNPYLRADLPIRIVSGSTYDVLAAADVAVVSSGTATVEAALIGAPMVVVYRVAPLTAWIARRLVRTPYFAMVNLIAGKRIVPELIQDNLTPERVAEEVEHLLNSSDARDEMRGELAQVRERLGPPGAIDRAADIIASMITR